MIATMTLARITIATMAMAAMRLVTMTSVATMAMMTMATTRIGKETEATIFNAERLVWVFLLLTIISREDHPVAPYAHILKRDNVDPAHLILSYKMESLQNWIPFNI